MLQYAMQVAQALETNTYVTSVDLSNCNIHNAGAVALAAALRNNSTVQSLKLEKNKVRNNRMLSVMATGMLVAVISSYSPADGLRWRTASTPDRSPVCVNFRLTTDTPLRSRTRAPSL